MNNARKSGGHDKQGASSAAENGTGVGTGRDTGGLIGRGTGFDEARLMQTGRGLALASLIIGLLTGLAVWLIVEFWIDGSDRQTGWSIASLLFVIALGAAWMLLAERDDLIRPVIGALAVASLIAIPAAWLFTQGFVDDPNTSDWPMRLWLGLFGPVAAFLLVVLVKACFMSGVPPHYTAVFYHGLTFPLTMLGAAIIAGLALALLFAWANLLKALDVAFFLNLFEKPWFILPFLGATGGFAVGVMRGQHAVLGALRFVLLLAGRLFSPIMAAFSLTLLAVLAAKGLTPVFDLAYPSAAMIALALVGILIFNAVYQNGALRPPPLWLRLATDIVLATLPIYGGIALCAINLRIEQYGLTTVRLAGLATALLIVGYGVVALAALVTEVNVRARRWAPLAAPFNTAYAALVAIVMLAMASPLLNPWALSARSQERLLAEGRVSAKDFEFDYLAFSLGTYGDQALMRLAALDTHPEAALIRSEVARVRSASSAARLRFDTVPPAAGDTDDADAPNGPNGPNSSGGPNRSGGSGSSGGSEGPPAPEEAGIEDLPLNPGSGTLSAENPADPSAPLANNGDAPGP